MLKGFLKRWPFVGLLVFAMGIAGGCVTNEVAINADLILEEMARSSAPAGSIESAGKTLVYSADLPNLVSKIRSVDLETYKKDLVMDYLILQERIDCILEEIEVASGDDTAIQCQGKILVDKEGEHGLLGISDTLEAINSRDGAPAKRDYLTAYLGRWNEIQKINRVDESLAQIKRSNAIPVFGMLIKTIHQFPILYEGDELVPRRDIPNLLALYRARDTEEARRAMVTEYLDR